MIAALNDDTLVAGDPYYRRTGHYGGVLYSYWLQHNGTFTGGEANHHNDSASTAETTPNLPTDVLEEVTTVQPHPSAPGKQ